jgi:hypothetical protein
MTLGFVWISLDSLVRIEPYQWVTRDFRWTFFRRLFFPTVARVETETSIVQGDVAELFMEKV